MGMFDYIQCNFPLPDGNKRDDFQTKSLDCLMQNYVITENGQLQVEVIHWETTLIEHKLKKMVDCVNYVNLTGIVNYYGGHDSNGVWCNYEAKFTEGKLVGIVRLKSNEAYND